MNSIVSLLKKKKKNLNDIVTLLLILLCLFQFIWLVYENLANISCYLGFDQSINLLYAMVAAKQGKLVAVDFESTTSQFLTPFESIMYAITKNIFFSQGFINILFMIVALIMAYISLHRIIENKENMLFCVVCLFSLFLCPFVNESNVKNINFGMLTSFPVSYYLPQIMCFLYALWGYLAFFDCKKMSEIGGLEAVILLLGGIPFTITAMGVYEFMIINILCPFILCVIIDMCVFNDWKNIFLPKSVWTIWLLLCTLVGVVINKICIPFKSASSNMHWITISKLPAHILSVLAGYFDIAAALPVEEEVGIFSTSSPVFIVGIYIVICMIAGVVILHIKLVKNYAKYHKLLPCIVTIIFCTLFYCLFDLKYGANNSPIFSCRYLCISFIAMFFIFVCFIDDIDESRVFRGLGVTFFSLSLIIMTVMSDYNRMLVRKDTVRLDTIKSIIDSTGSDINLVYFVGSYDDDVRFMRVWDSERVYKDIWDTGELFHWGDYLYSDEAADDQGPYMIFCRTDCEDVIPVYVKNKVQRIGEWDNYYLYYGKETVYDFETECNDAIGYDFPYSPSISIDHLEMNEDGEFVSDGSENIVMYGPNYQFEEGIYDVMVEYEVLESKDEVAGVFDMVKDEREIFMSTALLKDANTVGFYDLPIEDGTWLQYRVGEAEETYLKINKVVIEKKQ